MMPRRTWPAVVASWEDLRLGTKLTAAEKTDLVAYLRAL